MLVYSFSIRNDDGSDRQDTGRMALCSDNAARAFGAAMIWDMMQGNEDRYYGWTMDVAKGARAVCSIAFPQSDGTLRLLRGLVDRKNGKHQKRV